MYTAILEFTNLFLWKCVWRLFLVVYGNDVKCFVLPFAIDVILFLFWKLEKTFQFNNSKVPVNRYFTRVKIKSVSRGPIDNARKLRVQPITWHMHHQGPRMLNIFSPHRRLNLAYIVIFLNMATVTTCDCRGYFNLITPDEKLISVVI